MAFQIEIKIASFHNIHFFLFVKKLLYRFDRHVS